MLKFLQEQKLFLSLTLIILGLPFLFLSTSASMIEVYINDSSFGHGFFIFPIALWLIYRKKQQLSFVSIKPEPRLLILIIGVSFLWLVAKIVDVQVVQQLAVVLLIPVTIWAIYGRPLVVLLAFPLFFLFFAVPMGNGLIPPMMDFTADFTVSLVSLMGIPVYREGLLFTLPSGNWSVIEACSGVNYIISTFTLGTLYAYFTYSSITKRVIFIGIAIVISAISNGLRAFGIVMIGHLTDMQHGTGDDHTFYGWIFYGLVIFITFYIGSRWSDEQPAISNLTSNTNINQPLSKTGLIVSISIISTLVATQLYSVSLSKKSLIDPQKVTVYIPDNFQGWQYSENRDIGWEPVITAPDYKFSGAYVFGNDLIHLSIGYYANQRQGAEAVTSENHLSDKENRWKKVVSSDLAVQDTYVTETELSYLNGAKKILVWNWFIIGDWQTPSPLIAKFLNAVNILIHNRNDAAYITLASPITKNKENSREQLKLFMSDSEGRLSAIYSHSQ